MTTLLSGLHDREGAPLVPPGGWCLDTIALADNPPGTDYASLGGLRGPGVNWIARLNYGYGSTGTIPRPDRHGEMANSAGRYVAESRGCKRWVIANEPNHAQERAAGIPITPAEYARAFVLCRQAIKRAQPDAIVIPAPVAVWNVQTGDWLDYFLMVLTAIGRGGFDGLAVHSYIHRADADLVHSDAMMGPPFQDRHFEFHAYRDTLARVPAWAQHLPVYMTEANPLDGWQAVGIIPAMLGDVQWWNNQPDTQKIECVVFYRYPPHDEGAKWAMSTKPAVMAEFAEHAPKYPAPATQPAGVDPEPQPETDDTDIFLPTVPTGNGPVEALPPREWDPRLDARGIVLTEAMPEPGELYWRIVRGEYWQEKEHTFAETLHESGSRMPGVEMLWSWADGVERKVTELKPLDRWMVDFPMFAAGHSYGLKALGHPSDKVVGMGLGSVDEPNMGIHVSYKFVFRLTRAAQPSGPVVPRPQPPQPATVPQLVHPVQNPDYRRVSQGWGARPEYYSRFVYGGVPLQGHNGIDYATPVGSTICAVDGGFVVEARFDEGWGEYLKIIHPWGESLYAHLKTFLVVVGATVAAGQPIALSGNSGNSTGPHLHYGMRVNPYERADGWGGFVNPAPYLAADDEGESPVDPLPPANIVATVREAAREFSVDEELLLSLAWAESSYDPQAVSPAGAQGLFQVMPNTWAEQAPKVGATDPFNARDSARVGARYIAYLSAYYKGDIYKTLYAYNWGLGHVDAGGTPPPVTIEFANKVIFGRDLLRAVLP